MPVQGEENMNAFELLKEDHARVSAIFEKLEPTTERALKTREELFTKLKNELDVHTQIEEQLVYPVLKEEEETRDITLEGIEEHKVVKTLLQEMEAMPVDSEEWTAKLTVLKESVEHHVEEEEGEMFPKARKALPKEKIEELGARIEAAKKRLSATTRG
jgi:iron-sulfur cluster repair protein YtfE (RIC family)